MEVELDVQIAIKIIAVWAVNTPARVLFLCQKSQFKMLLSLARRVQGQGP
jgi:hypothetical protein